MTVANYHVYPECGQWIAKSHTPDVVAQGPSMEVALLRLELAIAVAATGVAFWEPEEESQ